MSEVLPQPSTEVKRNAPTETRTYQVLCDTCAGNYQTILLTGPHESGSELEFAGLRQAERLKTNHADMNRGHRTFLLMHTRNTLISTGVHFCDERSDGEEAVRS